MEEITCRKSARMPLHHGCLMPNKREKDNPKAMEERAKRKNQQECQK